MNEREISTILFVVMVVMGVLFLFLLSWLFQVKDENSKEEGIHGKV